MFDFVFRWRKASKCKKLIKRVLNRLEMLKKKRYSIVRQLHEDLAELINNRYQQIAFNRVEQLIKDERLMEAYELIESFCKLILMNLSYIRKNKKCPDDLMEAFSSLIFASARCGDFPELKSVRELFGKFFGQSFSMAAVELYPGNLVNPQIKEKLSGMSVSDDEKQRLINEIARDCFHPAVLALEYCPDWHQKQVLDSGVQTFCERIEGPNIQDSNAAELEKDVICVESSLVSNGFLSTPCRSTSNSYLPETTLQKELREVSNDSELASSWNEASNLEDNLDGEMPPLSDEVIVYLDEIVELQNSTTKDVVDLQDHRLFKFKSPVLTKREKVEDGYNQSYNKHHENRNKKSDLERSSKIRNGSRKASRRTSTCQGKQGIRDIECASYYDFGVVRSEEKRINSNFIRSPIHNHLENDLCGKDFNHKKDYILWTGVVEKEIEFDAFPRTQKRSFEIGTMVYDVFIYSHQQPEEFSTMGKYQCSLGSYEMEYNSTKHIEPASLPIQQSRDGSFHSNSCPNKYPTHVHPKLPDCDEIAAKFIALKREHLHKKNHQCGNL